MLDIFSKLGDLIAPPHPTVKVVRNEDPEQFVRFFSPHRVNGTVALSDFAHPTIRSVITANKFHNNEKASQLLSKLLEHWLLTVPEKETVFVPIPLSQKRLNERGYNQVARVLTNIKRDNCSVMQILVRTKDTKPQTDLDREHRFMNVKDAFTYIDFPNLKAGSRIVLVDDVITTGATMYSAKEILSEHLPNTEIISLALAH